jgi:hypothetical protein
MDPNRKLWNQQQQALRKALSQPAHHPQAVDLFLSQHAVVHSARMSQSTSWSCADEVLQDVGEEAMRIIPGGHEHSIAWVIWHIARIEDVTMNVLLAGSPQILLQDSWLERLGVTARDTGNAMDGESVAKLNATVDVEALLDYRLTVGRRTRQVVKQLKPVELKQKVEPARLQQVKDEGAVVEAANAVLEYWGGLTNAGLLLMPPTRHNFIHLNEALHIKQKIR